MYFELNGNCLEGENGSWSSVANTKNVSTDDYWQPLTKFVRMKYPAWVGFFLETPGDGLDTLLDKDGQNSIAADGNLLSGGDQFGDARVHREKSPCRLVQGLFDLWRCHSIFCTCPTNRIWLKLRCSSLLKKPLITTPVL